MNPEMILTVSAIVAAYITVFKGFKLLDNRFIPLVSLVIAAGFVAAPTWLYEQMVLISTIGLGAAGVYHTATGGNNK